MSEENNNSGRLERVFEKYANLQTEQANRTDEQISKLTDKVSELVTITAKAEQRHITFNESMKRIEQNQIDHGKDLKLYKQHNDDRVMEIEKTVLLLDKGVEGAQKPWQRIDAIKTSIITALLIAATLAYLGFK